MEILIAVISLGMGFLIGFFINRNSSAASSALIEEVKAAAREREEALIKEKENELRLQQNHFNELISEIETRHEQAFRQLKDQFKETAERISEQLKTTSEESLKRRQAEFAESSKANLSSLIEPLQSTISEMKKAVADNTSKHSELGGKLDASLSTLLTQTVAARASAEKLANALKSNQIQGEWGETVLLELLQSQGLREHIHFDTQPVMTDTDGTILKNENGKIMRPDLILHLDRTRDVIVDAKVSLTHYLEYINAESDDGRQKALDAHIRSIERHVSELCTKDYSSYVKPPKSPMGYVIMFVPNTSALLLATSNKPDLWRKAMDKKVYIADEQTLFAALKIISLTWQHIEQAQNHEKVYALADEMLARVSSFMEKYAAIGRRLEDASKSYQEGLAKLGDKGQSIPKTCEKLIKLGAKKPSVPKGVEPTLLGLED